MALLEPSYLNLQHLCSELIGKVGDVLLVTMSDRLVFLLWQRHNRRSHVLQTAIFAIGDHAHFLIALLFLMT